jgi:SAM-dependent methyltransferase
MMKPIVKPKEKCPCCGDVAEIFGVMDLLQNETPPCDPTPELSGIPVYYHRCKACGFCFTMFFGNWNRDEIEGIEDESFGPLYPRNETKYANFYAGAIASQFPAAKNMRVLELGGSGLIAPALNQNGFTCVDRSGDTTKATGAYDLVVCMEIMQWQKRPVDAFREAMKFVAPRGILYFSAWLQPPDILETRLHWKYFNPRRKHVSIYTETALFNIAKSLELSFGTFGPTFQAFWRGEPPDMILHLVEQAGMMPVGTFEFLGMSAAPSTSYGIAGESAAVADRGSAYWIEPPDFKK